MIKIGQIWSLKNDTKAETLKLFGLNRKQKIYPALFLKIHPIEAWGSYYNFSIWFIEIKGIVDKKFINNYTAKKFSPTEKHTMKLILKYLRKKPQLLNIYEQLKDQSGIEIEDSKI